MAIEWISEGDELPIVAQAVLLATPRQFGEWWDVRVRCILIRHEAVCPLPIKPGSKWPTDYYWGDPRDPQVGTSLVTGNSWWAHFDQIPLPPNAEHYVGRRRGERLIKQIGDVWIGKSKTS